MKKIDDISNLFNAQLPKGVFLNCRHQGIDNTMTIGWGSIGVMWGKPVLTVVVRYSRFTYELLSKTDAFTVSIPEANMMKEALKICGTLSGRNIDKFEKAGLTKEQAKYVDAPVIAGCELQIECKTLYKQSMEPGLLNESIDKRNYANKDYHVFFIGEIVESY